MERYQSEKQFNDTHLKHLEQLVENTRAKVGIQIYISGNESKIVTVFDQPIKLDPKAQYELALLNLETYYSFPNIDTTNNIFEYRQGDTGEWKHLEIPTGSYEISAIGELICKATKDEITIEPNLNTLKCILIVKETYEVNFAAKGSIASVLGFESKIYKIGTHIGEHSVNILKINSILVHTDIITSTYQDGRMEPIIYSFFPNVSPGEKIVAVQQNLIYAPVTTDTIYRMTTWLTDQDNIRLDLRGETITIRFHLREC